MKLIIQSINDVVTNSSMEVYQEADETTIDTVRDIINVILKVGGSTQTCDDLFDISIDYCDMYEYYVDRYLSDVFEHDGEYPEDLIHKALKVVTDSCIDSRRVYKSLEEQNLIGEGKLKSIEEFTDEYLNRYDMRYVNTRVNIIPKGVYSQQDVRILDRINDMFEINAEYDS